MFSDLWVEQGGNFTGRGDVVPSTVTLHTPYKNVNYNIFFSVCDLSPWDYAFAVATYLAQTTTNFQSLISYNGGNCNNMPFYWSTHGY